MREFHRTFLLSLARFIRSRPEVFEKGGRLLDRRFSLEALTDVRDRRIRATHTEYEEQRKLLESTGKLDHGEEESLANRVRLGSLTTPIDKLRRDRLEQLLRYGEEERRHLENTNTMLGAPLVRLLRAVSWAMGGDHYYGRPTHLEDMEAISLVTWLAFEPAANEMQPVLTRFQTLPWMPPGKIDGFEMQGRYFLHEHVADEHSGLVGVAEEALQFVELALVRPASSPPGSPATAPKSLDDSAGLDGQSEQERQNKTNPQCSHGTDFLWVTWYGTRYEFAKGNQAGAVRELWREWEQGGQQGGCGLSQETLQQRVAPHSHHSFQLRAIFRRGKNFHPAWGTMIKRVGKGIYALCPPDWAG